MSLISLSSCDPSPQRQLQDREAITITRMISLGNAIKTYREKNEGMLPGSPGLSWRVHILPLLDEGNLYREFHLNESWNSPHNESLISRMPGIFKPVEQDLDAGAAASGKTCYVAVIGDGTTGDAAAQRKRMADSALVGTAVVVQVETERSVTWTKPDGWEYARPKSISGLHIHTFQRPGDTEPTRVYVITGDGSLLAVKADQKDGVYDSLFLLGAQKNTLPDFTKKVIIRKW